MANKFLALLVAPGVLASPSNFLGQQDSVKFKFTTDTKEATGLDPGDDFPQFFTLTFDDALTPEVAGSIRKFLLDVVPLHKDTKCPLTTTYYASCMAKEGDTHSTCDADGNTIPPIYAPCKTQAPLVKGYTAMGHETADHTYNHCGFSNACDMTSMARWLEANASLKISNQASYPLPHKGVNGFRAPYLNYNSGMYADLKKVGLTWESSLTVKCGDPEQYKPSGGSAALCPWPFSLTGDDWKDEMCTKSRTGCDGVDEPDLAEMPMYMLGKCGGDGMDPQTASSGCGDIGKVLDDYLELRGSTNKAPLGIFLHGAWLVGNDACEGKGCKNGEALGAWLKKVQEAGTVHLVTASDLLNWMNKPVKNSELIKQRTEQCKEYKKICWPPQNGATVDCGDPTGSRGEFDAETCTCNCKVVSGVRYCPDSDGRCTVVKYPDPGSC